ncbi:MAG TPA: asparagine synthase (glutamine-hydrolyzing) [Desulfomonilaceae bacterium]|nr:asparagine synthase (glutamine-hydrolyzing) [Desulfomonilaceae bacterium]
MCGICGVWSYRQAEPVDPEILQDMTRQMTHRGPDEEGFFIDGPVGLGHRRLSIIDLTTGHQPLHNEDKTIWIVFNGEIYNYPELRTSLAGHGHRFLTTSDTEVIVHAYEEFGCDCVGLLNGMFAFAIWDASNQRLFLARDRMGIKPLCYTDWNGHFVFASELKSVLAYPPVTRSLDFTALNQYMAFEYVPTPRTIFKNIKKLPPGHSLTLERGHIRIHQYWDTRLALSEEASNRNQDQYLAELKETLKDVVRKEMIADVPTGVLLSGGIDSSTVAALMVKENPGGIKSFSIAFEDPSFDESAHARLVARHLGTEHHEMVLTSEMMLSLIPKVADFLDEPLGDSSIIPTYLLSSFVRDHVKVALGGDGGDELFGGYSTLQAYRLSEYYRHLFPAPVRDKVIPWIVNQLPVSFDNISFDFKLRRFASAQWASPVLRHHLWLGSFDSKQRGLLFGPLTGMHDEDVEDLTRQHQNASGAADALNQILYCDMKLYLEGDILPKVDKASMANSLEVRVPLLNPTLLEFAERLPHKFKLHGLRTKYLLRRAAEDLVPRSIAARGKKGFNMPVAKWMTGPLRPLAEDMFSEARLQRQGLFDHRYVRRLFDEHLARKSDHRKALWTLLIFQLWYDRWAR